MPFIKDLIGLNETHATALPIVDTPAIAIQWVNQPLPISIAGSRHSQGGHTMLSDAPMLLTECMNQVGYDLKTKQVTAGSGATWNNIHHALLPHNRSVLVQQSSAHFTLGGSLSVNCHGRDPRQGPLSSSVVSITVLLEDGSTQVARPGDVLFKAVVGGYGSCGMILQVTFNTCPNHALERKAKPLTISEYVTKLSQHFARSDWPEIHFAWLNFSQNDFFDNVLSVDYAPTAQPVDQALIVDDWIKNEAMQAAWATMRKNPSFRNQAWQILTASYATDQTRHRTNCLREAVGFTAYLDEKKADILQEFFVPLANLESFIKTLKTILKPVSVLSCTLRVVQQDNSTHLSYCAQSLMVSVVLDLNVSVKKGVPANTDTLRIQNAINATIDHHGTYYLPYYGFATQQQFELAYPNHANQRAAMAAFSPNRQFWNKFLAQYLS